MKKRFRRLLRKFNLLSSKIPGYFEILTTVMQEPALEQKIKLLERVIVLVNYYYPRVLIIGMVKVDKGMFGIKASFRCDNCQKKAKVLEYPIRPKESRFQYHVLQFELPSDFECRVEDKPITLFCPDCYAQQIYG